MANHDCMTYRPGSGRTSFSCPECGAWYLLALAWPGASWESGAERSRTRWTLDAAERSRAVREDLDFRRDQPDE